MVHRLIKRTLTLEIEKVYATLKTSLDQRSYKVISEKPPTHLLIKQGSLWGMSPTSAKKIVDIVLLPIDSGTEVTCSSRLSSDWKNVTIIGCALAAMLAGLCLWMAVDVNAFVANGKATFWSWLVTVGGNVDVSVAHAFVNLTAGLAVFLFVIVVLEIAVAVYAYKGIDRFAKGIFDSFVNNEPVASEVSA